MEFNPLHNFISPVTGRVLSDPDYVLVGNKKGVAIPSPILIDIRLDLQKVQNEIDKLTPFPSDISFIIKDPDNRVPNAQAMSILADGFMFNTAGTISTTNDIPLPNLTDGMIWLGNSSNRPVASKTINLDNLPSPMYFPSAKILTNYKKGKFYLDGDLSKI